jgi:hypothetical protein
LLPSGVGKRHQFVQGAFGHANRDRGVKQRQQMPDRRIKRPRHARCATLEIE